MQPVTSVGTDHSKIVKSQLKMMSVAVEIQTLGPQWWQRINLIYGIKQVKVRNSSFELGISKDSANRVFERSKYE